MFSIIIEKFFPPLDLMPFSLLRIACVGRELVSRNDPFLLNLRRRGMSTLGHLLIIYASCLSFLLLNCESRGYLELWKFKILCLFLNWHSYSPLEEIPKESRGGRKFPLNVYLNRIARKNRSTQKSTRERGRESSRKLPKVPHIC